MYANEPWLPQQQRPLHWTADACAWVAAFDDVFKCWGFIEKHDTINRMIDRLKRVAARPAEVAHMF